MLKRIQERHTESESREKTSLRCFSSQDVMELVIVIDAPPKKPLLFFDAVIGHKLMLFSLLFFYFLLFCLDREGKIALHTLTPSHNTTLSLSSVVSSVHANFPHTVCRSVCEEGPRRICSRVFHRTISLPRTKEHQLKKCEKLL